jgi:recombination protein RecA
MAKKDKEHIQETLKDINKRFGEGSAMVLGDGKSLDVERISSGSLNIDRITGGGLPMGRVIEIYGPESSGKTTLTLHAIVEAQKAYPDMYAAFIDAEHALDPKYAKSIGVDFERLIITQPDSGEQALEIAEAYIRSGDVSIVVIDSVDALTPEATLRGEMGDTNIARLARLMSQGLRKLTAAINRTKTLVVFVNQVREKVGVMFGNPETTPGGRALKFYATQRLRIQKQNDPKNKLDKQGEKVSAKVKCIKNKVSRPFLETFITIEFGKGINVVGEVLDLAIEYGIVERKGSWFSLNGDNIAQGRSSVIELLEEDSKLYDYLHKEVEKHINKQE